MIIRYGLKTASGYYYVEDHTQLFTHPTWFIYVQNRTYYILGLRLEVGSHPNNILTKDISSIRDFVGKQVMFYKHHLDDSEIWGDLTNRTMAVIEVVTFK